MNNAKDILSALILQHGGKITAVDISGRLVPALVAQTGASLKPQRKLCDFSRNSLTHQMFIIHGIAVLKTHARHLPQVIWAFYIGFGSEEAVIRSMNPNLNFDASPLPQVRVGRRLSVSHACMLLPFRAQAETRQVLKPSHPFWRRRRQERIFL